MRGELAFACIVLVSACKHTSEKADEETLAPAAVTCAPIKVETTNTLVEVGGVIAPPPKVDTTMSSPVAGRVSYVGVEEGDKVAAGTLLATVDDPSLPAGTVEADAVVAGAKAGKLAAEQEVARQEKLVQSGIGARKDLDDARAKAAAAQAELAAANARSGLARRNNARRELRAPHAGVVLHLWKRVGEMVDGTNGTPIVEIADVSTLEVHAQVPPQVLAPIREGMAATVRVVGIAAPLNAKVLRVAPALDPATKLGSLRIQIEGTQPITVGSAATAQIVTGTHQGALVPASALRRSMVGADEVVVCDKGVAHVRAVSIASRIDGVVDISSGLTAGEEVVTDHVLGLEEGQALTAAGAAPKTP